MSGYKPVFTSATGLQEYLAARGHFDEPVDTLIERSPTNDSVIEDDTLAVAGLKTVIEGTE